MGIAVSSCCMKKNYCHPKKLSVTIAGYSRLDVRTIMLKKYKTGVDNKAIDSAIFTYSGSEPAMANKKDTLDFADYATTSSTLDGIYTGNDWAIYMPSVRENYLITNILDSEHFSEKIRCTDNKSTCFNSIAHFTVNGLWTDSDILWIKKIK